MDKNNIIAQKIKNNIKKQKEKNGWTTLHTPVKIKEDKKTNPDWDMLYETVCTKLVLVSVPNSQFGPGLY